MDETEDFILEIELSNCEYAEFSEEEERNLLEDINEPQDFQFQS